jgi:hypothetical protein
MWLCATEYSYALRSSVAAAHLVRPVGINGCS